MEVAGNDYASKRRRGGTREETMCYDRGEKANVRFCTLPKSDI